MNKSSPSSAHIAELKSSLEDALAFAVGIGCSWSERVVSEWKFAAGGMQQTFKSEKSPSIRPMPGNIERLVAGRVEAIAPEFWKMVQIFNVGVQPNVHGVIEGMVCSIWRRKGRLTNIDREKSDEISEFIQSLLKRQCSYQIIAPLQNLIEISTASNSVQLTDRLSIREIAAHELEQIWGRDSYMSLKAHDSPTKFAIAYNLPVQINFGEHSPKLACQLDEAHKAVRDLELCIRLSKTGSVGCSRIYALPSSSWLQSPRLGGGDSGYAIPYGRVNLDQNDSVQIQSFWLQIQKKFHRDIRAALDRLHLAEIRHDPRDRILDAAIGLESLLLKESKSNPYRGELRYRFALNYGVMTNEANGRIARFKRARSMYDLRSAIAHCASDRKIQEACRNGKSLEEEASDCCAMLREAIRFFLDHGWPPSEQFWLDRLLGSDEFT